MAEIDQLTEQQKRALRGELPLVEFEAVAATLWELGIVAYDPLATAAGQPTGYSLTEKGVRIARELRGLPPETD